MNSKLHIKYYDDKEELIEFIKKLPVNEFSAVITHKDIFELQYYSELESEEKEVENDKYETFEEVLFEDEEYVQLNFWDF